MSQPSISTDQLAALLAGDLDRAAAEDLQSRIAASPEAAARLGELERVAAFLREERGVQPPAASIRAALDAFRLGRPGLAASIRDGARRLIAALDFDSRMPSAALGFRGTADAAQLAFSSEAGSIDLEVSADGARGWRVRGQLDAEGAPGAVLELLTEDGRVTATTSADGSGQFDLRTEAGTFTLRAHLGDTTVEAGPLLIP